MQQLDLNAIARALADSQPFTDYPAPHERLFIDSPGLQITDAGLIVPDGPWSVRAHPNRKGVDTSLLDAEIPTSLPRASIKQLHEWQSAGLQTDQFNRPLHPHWRALLNDKRIGLPTGVGMLYRYGPNIAVDAIVYRHNEHGLSFLVIRKGDTGKWGFPGGFAEPSDAGFVYAARRELAEETGLHITGKSEILYRNLPIRRRDTLHAWIEIIIILFHIPEDILQQPLQAGDDAVEAKWILASNIARMDLFDTHQTYLRIAMRRLQNKAD
ncbi:MAG TPA: NUDIX domain-containing protein [Candidatus Saccharimonadales bacterium]|nr:NUDIX domain-containing protein [Candidatus Saccharimonadales bacterium]